jgi:hypothetical protein
VDKKTNEQVKDAETKDMSFEELKAYFDRQIKNSPFGERIARLRVAGSCHEP